MNIGMISPWFAMIKGGAEHYTLHLSNKLADLGYDITIICGKQPFRKPEPLSERFKIEYVPQLFFPRNWGTKKIKLLSGGAWLVCSYQYMFSCYRYLLKNQGFDIIHTHDPFSLHVAVNIVKMKKRYEVPIVSTFHGPPALQHINDAKCVDAVTVYNREIKSVFEKSGITNAYYISPGVDLSHFKSMDKKKSREVIGLDDKSKIILFVGRLVPIKNLHNLLYAFKKTLSAVDDVKLLIVGDGILKRQLVHTAQKLGLGESVIFTGAVFYKDLPIYYSAADVFVLPSSYESFGFVCQEAAACGLPITVSTGADAFIREFGEDAIFTFPPDDQDSICSTIVDALTDKEEREEKLRESLKRVQTFSWSERAREVAKIYETVIRK
ncbi:glycosyltransferase family 4 protein [Chloroflexota bacterium]